MQVTQQKYLGLDVFFIQEIKIASCMLVAACRVIWPVGLVFASNHEAIWRGIVTFIVPH